MLTGIGLRNFKAFGDSPNVLTADENGKLTRTDTAPLSKITLIYGPNSGGKSSIIQALLLLKQSLMTKYAVDPRTPLTLRGTMVDLGSFQALLHRHDERREFRLNISCIDQEKGHDNGLMYKTDLTFSIEEGNGVLSSGQFQVTSLDSTLVLADSVVDTVTNITEGTKKLAVTKVVAFNPHHVSDIYEVGEITDFWGDFENFPSRALTIRDNDDHVGGPFLNSGGEISFAQYSGDRASGFLPDPVVPIFVSDTKEGRELEDAYFKTLSFAPNLGQAYPPRPLTVPFDQFVAHQLSRIPSVTTKHFNSIIYLGPLRSAPQRIYRLSGVDNDTTGIQGEFSANVLNRNAFLRRDVNYWFNGDDNEYRFDIPYKLEVVKLGEASLAGEYIAIALYDKRTATQVTIADVGYGINQLLPVIIEGIASQEGSIICVEQPEIHLHPRLQANIADLMIDTIADEDGKRKQWIVETHSELLILRLQRRIREGKIKPEDISVLYVDPNDESTEGSAIKVLRLGEDSYFKDPWPDGFFADSLKEQLAPDDDDHGDNDEDADILDKLFSAE